MYLALANPGVQKLGKFKWSKQKVWPACPLPGMPSWEAGWECCRSLYKELPDGWVTLSQEGTKAKRAELFQERCNSTSIAQLRRLSCHTCPFLQTLARLKAMKKKGARAQHCWLALHSPLWLHPASICCVLLFGTGNLCGPVESIPRDGISLVWVCICTLAHTGCFLGQC